MRTRSRHFRALAAGSLLPLLASVATAQQTYFPGPAGDWERRAPEQLGMDPGLVREAVDFARAHESAAPRDLEVNHYLTFGREPFGDALGPFGERGEQTGLIVRNGFIVAEWGEPDRVAATFSVAKSFLSAVVGLAYDRGLIGDVHELVGPAMAPVLALGQRLGSVSSSAERLGESKLLMPFEGPHNGRITWDHLLRQTSDWEGTLWGKPDWADRPQGEPAGWLDRPRTEPGSRYVYNDVRVNALALAALNLWREPLPQVLRNHLMDPIGASRTWRWFGYDNSWVLIDGVPMQSVSGGAHWGGGMFINAYDQARFGYLTLRRGNWAGRQILSEEWIDLSLTPTPAQPTYGFMNFFLNRDRSQLPSAPPTAFVHVGAGSNLVYVDPENDLVIVTRWIERPALDGVVQRVIASLR